MMTTAAIQNSMHVWINDRGPLVPVSFSVQTERIDVTRSHPESEPDPAWRFVDAAGHFHAHAADGSTPTLRTVADCPEDAYDCSHEGCLFMDICMICEQRIEPARVQVGPPGVREYVPGRQAWRLAVTLAEPFVHADPVSVRFERPGIPDAFAIGHVTLQERDDRYIVGTRVTIEGGERWEVMQP